jgi:enoyl-CoA hydratase/carnithine racemase
MPLVRVDERDGGYAVVTLNRPQKRNALSIDLRVELADALDRVVDAGCVVLTGSGSAFCAGMDTTQFGGDRDHRRRLVETSERLFRTVALSPLPIVAAINGPAVAGGFALALLCDIRLASTAARMGFPELGRHIPPSYAAARAALPAAIARELCLTGRVLDAAEALRAGVVAEVCEPARLAARADEVAAAIAGAPRAATREIRRRILLEGERTWLPLLDEEGRALREALLAER